ncbi:hypothetical protein HAX54_050286 [Datura stramonium]|uniref:Uncharacterized protein n=1 Tax=Datura stramonium TaxID=4076 RepID=A0ABS8SW73_DATST|nr:hypothetical protein [Datura stramonium]
MNYLRPGIKRGNFSEDEDDLIVRLHSLLGNRWSLIAGRLPGRTDNEIKNYWNTHLIKKLKIAGIEPKLKPHKNFTKKESREQPQKEKLRKKQGKKSNNNNFKGQIVQVEKIKVFAPKPIRISCGHSRDNSLENVTLSATTTCSSNSNFEEVGVGKDQENGIMSNENEVNFLPRDVDFGELLEGDGFYDEFLMGESYNFSNKCSLAMNDNMVEKVYEEYLLLLSDNYVCDQC